MDVICQKNGERQEMKEKGFFLSSKIYILENWKWKDLFFVNSDFVNSSRWKTLKISGFDDSSKNQIF